MPDMIKNLSPESITELYRNSEELLLILDDEQNTIFLNKSAENLFGKVKK